MRLTLFMLLLAAFVGSAFAEHSRPRTRPVLPRKCSPYIPKPDPARCLSSLGSCKGTLIPSGEELVVTFPCLDSVDRAKLDWEACQKGQTVSEITCNGKPIP